MEERELVERFHETYDLMLTILWRATKAFLSEKEAPLKEAVDNFRDVMKARVAHAESIIAKRDKDEAEKRYVNLVPSFQAVALGIESLLYRMLTKVRLRVLLSEKAFNELRNLFNIMEGQLRNAKDYVQTSNPHLKEAIHHGLEQMMTLADNYAMIHHERLIAGVCVPEASYVYVDMTDSFKRVSRALVDFTDRF
jgi:phosphate uptake regulator